MLEKKLTALGCAAGIILFGACYGGTPDPNPRPTAPPLAGPMKRLHSIRIIATNTSASKSLTSDGVARAVARRWHADHTGIAIYLEGAPQKKGESTLTITVLSESSLPPQRGRSSGSGSATVVVRISAVLTGEKGNLIWIESDRKYSMACSTTSVDEMDALTLPACQAAVEDMIAAQLVDGLVFALKQWIY